MNSAPTRRLVLSAAVGLLVSLTAAPVVPAQTPPLEWELVGTEESPISGDRIDGIAFREGVAPDGALDTLYTLNRDGVFRFLPGAGDWERICAQARCRTDYMEATKEGYLLIGSTSGTGSGGGRSTDGGFTWEYDITDYGVSVLFQSTLPALGGAVYAGNANSVSYSYDGGAAGSWTLGEPMGGQPTSLAEVLPSESLPVGRLLGGAWNGAAYSDDGGQTWTPSSLWQPGRFVVASLTFLPLPGHPYGGAAFAGVRDFGLGRPAVYRSDDGGLTWEQVLAVEAGDYGVAGPDWIVVQAAPGVESDGTPGGVVFAGVRDDIAGTAPSVGPIIASADGGQTWAIVADSASGWGGWGVRVFEVGRDGRLYVGTDRGVWRTTQPLPVATEGGPEAPEQTGARLEVHPNPSAGKAVTALTLTVPSDVRVAVYDVLGRRVATLAKGRLEAGTHRLRLDGGGLPPGLYFVRATGVGFHAVRQIALVK